MGSVQSLHTRGVEYKHDGVVFEGTLAYDGSVQGRRPGVLLAHASAGLDGNTRRRAIQLARMGFTAFALDMYGGGRLAETDEEALKLSSALLEDRPLLRARAEAGLKVLRRERLVEARRIAVVGYGFGGAVALELARSGADVRGAVSFHGTLAPGKAESGEIRGKVLVLHGADDELVTQEQVSAFQEEMRAANADWQMVTYGRASHGFTTPGASTSRARYDEAADQRSWLAMRAFLDEVFS